MIYCFVRWQDTGSLFPKAPAKQYRSKRKQNSHVHWCILDRFGKNSEKSFVTLSESEVLRFVEYDITENVYLTIGSIILCQGARGIPIVHVQ